MKKEFRRKITRLALIFVFCALALAIFSIFFDQAVLVRRETFYKADISEKVVAFTFDDGPSPEWTPKILDELKRAQVKATFFMIGQHVQKYPEVARRVAQEGHDIGIHSFSHHIFIFAQPDRMDREISDTRRAIREVTGRDTRLFRPPKAWLTEKEKKRIKDSGYEIVLWTLNSKDWVTFDDKYMIRYIMKNIQPGDIILFHDSGGVLATEGGSRHETVVAIFRLVEKLREHGYRCVTVSQLLEMEKKNAR